MSLKLGSNDGVESTDKEVRPWSTEDLGKLEEVGSQETRVTDVWFPPSSEGTGRVTLSLRSVLVGIGAMSAEGWEGEV